MSKKTINVNVVSGPSLLTGLFVGLKLTGYIDWSWWWVTAPSWAPLAIVTAILGLAAVLAFIATVAE